MANVLRTEAEIADKSKVWSGEDLFNTSMKQLFEIIAARGLEAEGDANKKTLVSIICEAQIAAELQKPLSDLENEGGIVVSPEEATAVVGGVEASEPTEDELGFEEAKPVIHGIDTARETVIVKVADTLHGSIDDLGKI